MNQIKASEKIEDEIIGDLDNSKAEKMKFDENNEDSSTKINNLVDIISKLQNEILN